MRRAAVLSALVLAAFHYLPTPGQAANHAVAIQDNSFNPPQLNVCVGDTVTWSNQGSMPHTTTSGAPCGTPSGTWNSNTLNPGQSFSRVFGTGGDFDYYCAFHCPTMTGKVSVVQGPTSSMTLAVNKLRAAHDPLEGRGGTAKGLLQWSGATAADVQPGSVEVTLRLTGRRISNGTTFSIAETVRLTTDSRGNHSASLPADPGKQMNVTSVIIRGVTDPALAKYSIRYETNGIDLSDVAPGSLQLAIEVLNTVDGACGLTDLLATASGTVQI